MKELNWLEKQIDVNAVTDRQARELAKIIKYLRGAYQHKISEQRLRALLWVVQNQNSEPVPTERQTCLGEIEEIPPESVEQTKRGVFGKLMNPLMNWGKKEIQPSPEPFVEPEVVPTAESEENPAQTIQQELQEKIAPRSNLLEETLQACRVGAQPQAAAKALEHWRSTLDAGECRMLLEQFQQLTGDENERLRGWLEWLREHRLEPMDEAQDNITVTPQNRARYINGVSMPNGCQAFIVRHPWSFEGAVCSQGVLGPLSEETDESEEL